MTDTFLPSAASPNPVVLRAVNSARAGTLAYEAEYLVTGWHHHDLHQIEYALEGVAEVETRAGRYLVPPQQAIWIPAGLEHNTTLRRVRSASVFLHPSVLHRPHGDGAKILAAAPLLREMIVYALQWPITRTADEDTAAERTAAQQTAAQQTAAEQAATAFFAAVAVVVEGCLDREQPLWLPTSADPFVAAVISYTEQNLATVTADDVARALSTSERTLRRRFHSTTGMTWRTFLARARLVHAMAALAEPGSTVLDVAMSVGFGSVSAFTRAFRTFTGLTPADYRRRAQPRAGLRPALPVRGQDRVQVGAPPGLRVGVHQGLGQAGQRVQ